jgi:hypothetical protein
MARRRRSAAKTYSSSLVREPRSVALEHRVLVRSHLRHLHHRIPMLDQSAVRDAIDVNKSPFGSCHFIARMKDNHIAFGKDMLELDLLLWHSLRGEHLYERLYALRSVSDRRIVLYEILAEEFVDCSYV